MTTNNMLEATADLTNPNQSDDNFTKPEAAKYLRISIPSLDRRMRNGEIAFFRVGSRIVFSRRRHLDEFLARCERQAK